MAEVFSRSSSIPRSIDKDSLAFLAFLAPNALSREVFRRREQDGPKRQMHVPAKRRRRS